MMCNHAQNFLKAISFFGKKFKNIKSFFVENVYKIPDTRDILDKNKYFINAKKTAKEYGVTCLNFYAHFPNEDGYVINRIRENL